VPLRCAQPGGARRAESIVVNAPVVSENLKSHPRLGQWLGMQQDGRIRACSGKVEIGQGILHALRLIVAEELRVAPDEVLMLPATTESSPDEAVTSGSLSIQHSGAALRYAAAHLRETCRNRFAQAHGVARDAVELQDGVFSIEGRPVRARYQDLVDAAMLAADIEPLHLQSARAPPALRGHGRRHDIEMKVFGEFEYINDLVFPGMCFGQVFRPKTLLASIDEPAAARLEQELSRQGGVIAVARDGILVGVLAEAEHVLAKAARKVQAADLWHGTTEVPAPGALAAWLKSQPLETSVILDQRPPNAPADAAQVFRAEFERPYLQHASIGLCCAIAQWDRAMLRVWSHSQGIFNLRRDLANAFGVPADAVVVSHREAAGCYGHNGADDVAFDAAWLARHAAGRPVKLQWTRQQEMANSPRGTAMTVSVEAGVDQAGNLCSWKQEVWSQGHGSRPGRGKTPALLGAWQTAQPFPVTLAVNQPPGTGGGSDRNAVPPYGMAQVEVLNHRVLAMPLRVSALRSLGAHLNVLAAESIIDEVATSQGRDPLAYRLEHLQDERAKAVLREAARISGWAPSKPPGAAEGFGRGIGFARYKNTSGYCAVVAELVLAQQVRLKKLCIAADLGRVVHPDGARNQLEGGAIQAASWTLCESAQIGPDGIESEDWESYPIFKFSDVPEVAISLLERPDCASLGAGECSAGPTAAAIANAIHDAIGVRVRAMPFSADNLMKLVQSEPTDP
jgi:nicotinate dehydrogenase subunit B